MLYQPNRIDWVRLEVYTCVDMFKVLFSRVRYSAYENLLRQNRHEALDIPLDFNRLHSARMVVY